MSTEPIFREFPAMFVKELSSQLDEDLGIEKGPDDYEEGLVLINTGLIACMNEVSKTHVPMCRIIMAGDANSFRVRGTYAQVLNIITGSITRTSRDWPGMSLVGA
jgi:hypothetical protein